MHKYLDGSIEGGADEEIAGEERETPDSAAVTSQHLRALAVFQTPNTDRLVATSGHQTLVVERHTQHSVRLRIYSHVVSTQLSLQ